MDLFREKVKQNRSLLKSRGNKYVFLIEKEYISDAISMLEIYSKSIIIFEGNCTIQLSKIFHDLEIILLDKSDMPTKIEHLLRENNTDSGCNKNLLENPCSILIEINPKVDSFLLNDRLINTLYNSDFFYSYTIFPSKHTIYPVFLPTRNDYQYTKEKQPVKIKAVLLDWFFGNGDVAIIYKQLKKFIQLEEKNCRVDIITRGKPLKLLQDLFPECRIYTHFDSYYIYEFLTKSNFYSDVHFINTRLDHPPHLHLLDVATKSLGFSEPVSPFISKELYPLLPTEIEDQLMYLKCKGSSVVGIQLDNGDGQRSWDGEHINKLVRICKENHITLINLTPSPHISNEFVDLDVSLLPISKLFTVISKLDAVVSIDSVCGHIAGVVGTPSITIWGKDKPLASPQNPFVSFRVLSQNYSLCPTSNEINDIPSELVFKHLIRLLESEFSSPERITIDQTISGYNIEEI
ncbi:glycosyltransferase family 9 protein [Oceanobacillus profundus]|uniref:Lipopolysaccharide heptosyltransferase family protein n=1 Tax=Oceanobacillus profundus TaxID=372463 RepID=A0A417YI52_9BACI|nr:glycosyltransferase family 9 protein [Oceanobacillus profundus]RHW32562.1 hypothetical protein D1B32_09530 [Oceanobacillus profundus]